MFKLNKATHMMILMTFTIVFVVVYMYYMISDVKKMYVEVKKHGQEIVALQKLSGEVQEIKNVVSSFGSLGSSAAMVAEAMFMPSYLPPTHIENPMSGSSCPPITVKQTSPAPPPPPPQAPLPSSQPDDVNVASVEDDDVDSVATEDIKKLVEDCGDDEEKPALPSEEEVKKMKFEDIRDLCKKHTISTKGTKDVLIARFIEYMKQ